MSELQARWKGAKVLSMNSTPAPAHTTYAYDNGNRIGYSSPIMSWLTSRFGGGRQITVPNAWINHAGERQQTNAITRAAGESPAVLHRAGVR